MKTVQLNLCETLVELRNFLLLLAIPSLLWDCNVFGLFENCTQLIQLASGGRTYIYSPNYPNLYPYGSSCFYNIVAPIDHRLRITCALNLTVLPTTTTTTAATPARCGTEIFYYNSEGSELLANSEYFCGNGSIERTSFLNRATLYFISNTTNTTDGSGLIDIRGQRPQQQTAVGLLPPFEAVQTNDDSLVLDLGDQLYYDTPEQLLYNRKYFNTKAGASTYQPVRHQTASAATYTTTYQQPVRRQPTPYNQAQSSNYDAVSNALTYIHSLLNYEPTSTTPATSSAYEQYQTYRWRIGQQTRRPQTRGGSTINTKKLHNKRTAKKLVRIVNNGLTQNATNTTALGGGIGGGVFSCLVEALGPACTCGWSRAAATLNAPAPATEFGTINEAGIHEFPSTAGVMTRSNNEIVCGATIIHTRYLLSAAHCYSLETTDHPALLRVVVGEHDLATTTETNSTMYYDLAKIIRHELFYATPLNIRNDIALLRTTVDMSFGRNIGPACLPFRDNHWIRQPIVGQQVVVAGWGGITLLGGQQFSMLRKYYLSVVNAPQCKREIGALPYGTFCTFTSLTQNVCQYDSGGAVYASNGEYLFVIGITSYGYPCTVNKPSVNTRVSSHIKWILSKTPEVNYCVK